jgi:hypothetical protein
VIVLVARAREGHEHESPEDRFEVTRTRRGG